jgi:D-tyrosyl-tRNA(Tyr) deacylase
MRIVLQRVSSASVRVEGETIGAIGGGLLALVGVREGDDEATALKLAAKTVELRVFPDQEGRFNRRLLDLVGPADRGRAEALVISQFTLYADLRRGRRPSFNSAARPALAEPLVDAYARALEAHGVQVARGRFGAYMLVESVNDGPVTIILDSNDLDRPRRA